jgi:hypothetical protein
MTEDVEDSVAAHALNAVPGEESLPVEAALRSDEELSDQYDAHRRIAGQLVDGFSDVVPAPSPDLWGRIAHEAGFGPAAPPRTTHPSPGRARFSLRIWSPLVVGAAALVVAAAITAGLISATSEPPNLDAMAAAAADLPGSLTVTLTDPTGSDVAEAVVASNGQAFIDGARLPTLPENRTYQLWAIVEDRVVSVGIMGNRPTVSSFRVEGRLAGLAVSEEKLGGVAVSETDPVAVWLDGA